MTHADGKVWESQREGTYHTPPVDHSGNMQAGNNPKPPHKKKYKRTLVRALLGVLTIGAAWWQGEWLTPARARARFKDHDALDTALEIYQDRKQQEQEVLATQELAKKPAEIYYAREKNKQGNCTQHLNIALFNPFSCSRYADLTN